MRASYLSEILSTENPGEFYLRRHNNKLFPILGEEGPYVFIQTKENPLVPVDKITIKNADKVDLSSLKKTFDMLRKEKPEYFL